jgi:hypothetical protein
MTDRKKPDIPRQPKPKVPRKPKSPHYKGDNSGGFGNPPVGGQFKPNNKGGGRPKGSQSMSGALRKVFTSKVNVRRGDKLVQVPTVQALATRIRDRALTGSDRALFLAQQLANEFGPRDKVSTDVTDQLHSDPETDLTDFTEDELNILSSLLRRALGEKSVGNKSRADISRMEGDYRLFERDDGYLGIERCEHDDGEKYEYDESEF